MLCSVRFQCADSLDLKMDPIVYTNVIKHKRHAQLKAVQNSASAGPLRM
jgi:hypothetical protein